MDLYRRGSQAVAVGRARLAGLDGIVLEPADPRSTVVFFHGFPARPGDYLDLLEHVASHGFRIVALRTNRPGFALFSGRLTVADEAARALPAVEEADSRFGPITLAGHSRGGQLAWRLASRLAPAALLLLDPVDGSGRGTSPDAAAAPAEFDCRTVILAATPGRCAPHHIGPEVFAAASPPGLRHAAVDGGHADILSGRRLWIARMLCPGAADPDPVRRAFAGLAIAALRGDEAPLPAPVGVTVVSW